MFAARAESSASASQHSLTLLEAWEIFDVEGKKWNDHAAIASLQSVDVAGDSGLSGQDGRRRGWTAVIIAPGASLWLRLVNGDIVDRTVQPAPVGLAALTKPDVDSPQALAAVLAARADFGASADLKAGQGFHFVLETSGEGSVDMKVLGAIGQHRAQVYVDPDTGAVLTGQIYTYAHLGGILYSSDGGLHWQASSLQGKMITALAPDPDQTSWAYAAAAEQNGIVVYQSKDNGVTWQQVGVLPLEAGDWPFDLLALRDSAGRLKLLVGTWNGLWSSSDGQRWEQDQSLPQGPVQWLAAIQPNGKYRLLATVSSGDHRGLYSSTAFNRWTKIADDVYRLSESFDRQMVIATAEEQGKAGLLLDIQGEERVLLPATVLHAAGDFHGAPILLHSPAHGSGIWDGVGEMAAWTLAAPVACLVVSPDFPTSHLAIAGGFRSGIYRTVDGGRHWEQVLPSPSSILPGSDEIYEAVFLSPSTVIAVNGGELAWQEISLDSTAAPVDH